MKVEEFERLLLRLSIMRDRIENNYHKRNTAMKLNLVSNKLSDDIWREMDNDPYLFRIYCHRLGQDGYNI